MEPEIDQKESNDSDAANSSEIPKLVMIEEPAPLEFLTTALGVVYEVYSSNDVTKTEEAAPQNDGLLGGRFLLLNCCCDFN